MRLEIMLLAGAIAFGTAAPMTPAPAAQAAPGRCVPGIWDLQTISAGADAAMKATSTRYCLFDGTVEMAEYRSIGPDGGLAFAGVRFHAWDPADTPGHADALREPCVAIRGAAPPESSLIILDGLAEVTTETIASRSGTINVIRFSSAYGPAPGHWRTGRWIAGERTFDVGHGSGESAPGPGVTLRGPKATRMPQLPALITSPVRR